MSPGTASGRRTRNAGHLPNHTDAPSESSPVGCRSNRTDRHATDREWRMEGTNPEVNRILYDVFGGPALSLENLSVAVYNAAITQVPWSNCAKLHLYHRVDETVVDAVVERGPYPALRWLTVWIHDPRRFERLPPLLTGLESLSVYLFGWAEYRDPLWQFLSSVRCISSRPVLSVERRRGGASRKHPPDLRPLSHDNQHCDPASLYADTLFLWRKGKERRRPMMIVGLTRLSYVYVTIIDEALTFSELTGVLLNPECATMPGPHHISILLSAHRVSYPDGVWVHPTRPTWTVRKRTA